LFPNLKALSLGNCLALTVDDAGVVGNLLSAAPRLQWLNLSGCDAVNDTVCARIARLRRLRHLDLSQCIHVPDRVLDILPHLRKLSSLRLERLRAHGLLSPHASLHDISPNIPTVSVKVLDVSSSECVDDAFLQHLGQHFVNLEDLNISKCALVTDDGLAHLASLRRLRTLNTSGCLRLTRIPNIESLTSVDISNTNFENANRETWARPWVANLKHLNLDSCNKFENWGVWNTQEVRNLSSLRSLNLADTDINDEALPRVCDLTNLTDLSLFYCNLRDAGMKHLRGMTNLVCTGISLLPEYLCWNIL
jgi:hypothetical protein